jgi:signal transduction histidine kinase
LAPVERGARDGMGIAKYRTTIKTTKETCMRKFFYLALAILTFSLSASSGAADSHGTPEEAMAMVGRAIAAIKTEGFDKIVAEINEGKPGRFRDRDLYITINDLNAKNIAHGANPKMQGKDLIELKDADGKYFMRERVQLAAAKGKGWQDYKFVNPVSKQIEAKSMYFERYGDHIINCGIYK